MAEIRHWADVTAEEVLEKGNSHLVASGITPSGHIHIGNMREVVTADAVYRTLADRGADARLIYIADTFDPLRKVYPFLDDSYAEHVGKPLSEIPAPGGAGGSYADYFLQPFLAALETLGIRPEVYRADEMYKTGIYNEAIREALLNRDRIAAILKEESGKDVAPDWSPFNPVCNACGRISGTKVTGFDPETDRISYECVCGDAGEVPVQGGGKLTWRVDWPARWKVLGVTVEPFGKDHASRGGSYDTGKRISKEIFGYEAPHPVIYEWIMLGKEGAMSSSTGVVVSISDMLKVVPPEVLRYLIIRTKPEKHIRFDPAMPLLTLVDNFERLSTAEDISGYDRTVLKLSHASGLCHTDIPFKHMTTIYQVADGDADRIMEIVERAGYDTEKEKCIRELADNVASWLEMFAPDMVKFSVQENVPTLAATLTDEQRAFLKALTESLKAAGELDGDAYHNLIYSAKEEGGELHGRIKKILGVEELALSPKTLFKAIYIAVLGQASGPKAGWFLSSLERDFLIRRFSEAADFRP
jgi:lysyl-tRNA synthetase class 1